MTDAFENPDVLGELAEFREKLGPVIEDPNTHPLAVNALNSVLAIVEGLPTIIHQIEVQNLQALEESEAAEENGGEIDRQVDETATQADLEKQEDVAVRPSPQEEGDSSEVKVMDGIGEHPQDYEVESGEAEPSTDVTGTDSFRR